MRVITDLKAKGVHPDLIDTAVTAAFDDVNEEKQARAYLQRKRLQSPRSEAGRAHFPQSDASRLRAKTIFTILKMWDLDDETLTALEESTE